MLVTIDLTDTSGYSPALGDKVEFEAKNLIGSATTPGRVISTAPVRVELESGIGQVQLDPGPHILRIKARNYRDASPITFTVPEGQEEMTLRELLESKFEYEPDVVQDAQQYMLRARESADRAEASERRLGSAEAIVDSRDRSEAARDGAEESQSAAQASAEASEASATRSEGEADRAEAAAGAAAADTDALLAQHVADSQAARDAASGSASDASSSASGAAGSAAASAGSAAGASVAHQDAESAQVAAEAAASRSASQADDASDSADAAALSATVASDNAILSGQNAAAAEVSAGNAQDAADEAADDVRAALSGHVTAATASKDAAKTSETNAATSAAAARQSEINAAEAVSSGVPDASADSKGKVKLAGDLGGTADAPTVPGLLDKADKTHTHTSTQVDGLDPIMATVNAATYQAEASTLMRRTSSGRVSVAAPSEAANAANKQYVDQALLTKVDTTSTASRLYGTGSGGAQTQVQYANAATASTIPLRGTNGTLPVGAPTSGEHAATKTYVDTTVATRKGVTHSGPGPAPSTIAGAVVGDWWLNETTMELSKITGV